MAKFTLARTALSRGLRKRCPSCGLGKLFEKWNQVVICCPHCGYAIRKHENDTWFFMYMSTAATTGSFILLMILITPTDTLLGRVILAVAVLSFFFITTENRKGFALAVEYLVDRNTEHPN